MAGVLVYLYTYVQDACKEVGWPDNLVPWRGTRPLVKKDEDSANDITTFRTIYRNYLSLNLIF